jgi:two-component system response regulator YesN
MAVHKIKSKSIKWIRFLKIMEKIDENDEYSSPCFEGEFVQAAILSFEKSESFETSHLLQKLEIFFPKEHCYVFPYKDCMAILFEDTPETIIKHLLEKLYDYLRKSNRFVLTLGSRCLKENGAGIRKTCREAEELLDKSFFFWDLKYLSHNEVNARKEMSENIENKPDIDKESCNFCSKLCSYVQVIDHEKIQSFFRDMEKAFLYCGKSPLEIRQECMTLLIELRGVMIHKVPALKELMETSRETLNAIMECPFLRGIMDIMTEACIHISNLLPLLSADNSFQRIMSYVNNNYAENLRLEGLGQLFNYNCAYLGKRFKEYTGKSFHTYLDMLRIDAAKELLQSTGMKVYEISSAVGYSNTDYFYSKFRKYAGESPLIYKKSVMNHTMSE